ncbi:MAG: site-specific DNA-methyltransferase [Clostridia bacterium]|nr:site-specific DNA-methyltransferase [Clostridia bacterium]
MVELSYSNKKSIEEIVNKAKQCEYNCNFTGSSVLLQGENFDGLSLLLKEGLEGKIDLVYIDPPFNTSQDFVVDDTRKCAVSKPKAGTVAYCDKFGFDEYLEFIRERVILIHKLLSEKGSFYFHIDTKMGHYCKIILDEVFGRSNFKNDITRIKSNPKNFARTAYGNEKDLILFYAKYANKNIWNEIAEPLSKEETERLYKKKDERGYYTTIPLHAPGETADGPTGRMWRGMLPPKGRHWRTNPDKFDELDSQGLIEWSATGNPRIKKYVADHKGKKMQDVWEFKDPQNPEFPTQKNEDLLKRIVMQSSNADSIVMDCFAGSGTTLVAAEKLGRKWIGIDKSEEAISVIKKRLDKADYFFSLLD